MAERIEFIRSAIVKRKPKSVIKSEFTEKFGKVSPRTIERYLSRARELILSTAADSRDWFRAQSLALYGSILSGDKVKVRDRIKAQERIDKLLGLESKIPMTGLEEFLASLPPEFVAELRRVLGEQLSQGATRALGEAAGRKARPS